MRTLGLVQEGIWKGQLRFTEEPQRPVDLVVQFQVSSSLWEDVLKKRRLDLRGHVSCAGLVREAPFVGEIRWQLFPHWKLDFEAPFVDDSGRSLVLSGELRPERQNLSATLTRWFIRLDKEGKTLASGALQLRLADLPGWLGSWVPTLREKE